MNFKTIDTKMHGYPGITGTFLLEGEQKALIETGPGSSLRHVLAGLSEHDVQSLDWIVLTHIHLDHAGAAGALAQRYPEAKVAVHPAGAPHLVNTEKLWSSATRIYGDQMERMWGEMVPIEESRIQTISDGDVIDLGGRKLIAVETPGHARHHHAFLEEVSGTVFTGDAAGVRLPDIGYFRPTTPPPEFNLEDMVASIEKIRRLGAVRLCLTHYGAHDEGEGVFDVDATLDKATDVIHRWAEWVREARRTTTDLDEATALVRERAGAEASETMSAEALQRMEQTTTYRMNTWGYMRYFDKQEKAAASRTVRP